MNGEIENIENAIPQTTTLPPENSQPKTLRRAALAKMFGVCPKTIRRHLDKKILPQPDFYVGRFPHWKLSSILNWIETRKMI
jgi:predicted DNA-binding transcriptional regulator AlpA